MSYILDALKRAERERRAGSQSLLDELPNTAPAPAHAAWRRWVAVAAASALVSALLVWLFLSHRSTVAPAAVVAQAPAPAPVPAPLPPSPEAAGPPALAEAPASTLDDDGRIESLDDLQAEDSAPRRPARAPETTEAAPPAETRLSRTRGRDAAGASAPSPPSENPPPAEEAGAEGSVTTIPEGREVESPPQRPDAAKHAGAVAPDEAPLQQMSEAYRASFPDFTVDVHSYSESPDQRFVLIGGKRYKEGDHVPPGATIVGIVPEGIVFDWNGQRVLFALPH